MAFREVDSKHPPARPEKDERWHGNEESKAHAIGIEEYSLPPRDVSVALLAHGTEAAFVARNIEDATLAIHVKQPVLAAAYAQ